MDYNEFYDALFAPLESSLGPVDPETIVPVIGFDAGGPLSFCTIGRSSSHDFVTYVSCEIAVRESQTPASFGRYELLASCNDENWVRATLTELAWASMEFKFGDRHTIDIAGWVEPGDPIQGLLLEKQSTTRIDGKKFGVMRVIGVTRPELELAIEKSAAALISRLKKAGVYPHTDIHRSSVV